MAEGQREVRVPHKIKRGRQTQRWVLWRGYHSNRACVWTIYLFYWLSAGCWDQAAPRQPSLQEPGSAGDTPRPRYAESSMSDSFKFLIREDKRYNKHHLMIIYHMGNVYIILSLIFKLHKVLLRWKSHSPIHNILIHYGAGFCIKGPSVVTPLITNSSLQNKCIHFIPQTSQQHNIHDFFFIFLW